MSELLSLQAFMDATETALALPERVAKLLGRPTITVKVIDGGRFNCFFPSIPEEVRVDPEADPKGDAKANAAAYTKRVQAWVKTLAPAERIQYRLETEQVKYHVLALAALDPRLTYEAAERFGDDANPLYLEILRFSHLTDEIEPPAKGPAPDAAESTA